MPDNGIVMADKRRRLVLFILLTSFHWKSITCKEAPVPEGPTRMPRRDVVDSLDELVPNGHASPTWRETTKRPQGHSSKPITHYSVRPLLKGEMTSTEPVTGFSVKARADTMMLRRQGFPAGSDFEAIIDQIMNSETFQESSSQNEIEVSAIGQDMTSWTTSGHNGEPYYPTLSNDGTERPSYGEQNGHAYFPMWYNEPRPSESSVYKTTIKPFNYGTGTTYKPTTQTTSTSYYKPIYFKPTSSAIPTASNPPYFPIYQSTTSSAYKPVYSPFVPLTTTAPFYFPTSAPSTQSPSYKPIYTFRPTTMSNNNAIGNYRPIFSNVIPVPTLPASADHLRPRPPFATATENNYKPAFIGTVQDFERPESDKDNSSDKIPSSVIVDYDYGDIFNLGQIEKPVNYKPTHRPEVDPVPVTDPGSAAIADEADEAIVIEAAVTVAPTTALTTTTNPPPFTVISSFSDIFSGIQPINDLNKIFNLSSGALDNISVNPAVTLTTVFAFPMIIAILSFLGAGPIVIAALAWIIPIAALFFVPGFGRDDLLA